MHEVNQNPATEVTMALEVTMTITILVKGKKISREDAEKQFGKERVERRILEAVEEHCLDPLTCNEWMDGMEIRIED